MTSQIRTFLLSAPVAFLIIGPFTYFLADRQPPYEYLFGEILPPVPDVGEHIWIHWHVKTNRFCPGWVERNIVDRRGYIWRNTGSPVRDIAPIVKAGVNDVINQIELPRQLGAGPAKYQAHVTYRCNWLQRWFWPIAVDTPVLEFTIK